MWKKHTSDVDRPSEKKHVDEWKQLRKARSKDDVVRVHSQPSAPVKKTVMRPIRSSPQQRTPFPKSESQVPARKTISKPIKQPVKKPPVKPVKKASSPLVQRAEQAKKKPPVKKG